MSAQYVYWLIDDNEEEADDYKQLLERESKRKLRIQVKPAYPNLKDYTPLLNDEQTGGFIIDQWLDEFRASTYSGLDLASYLRRFKPELPIFILTKLPVADLETAGGSVEQIISKPDVHKSPATYTARLLRRLGEYDQALNERESRFKELIDKKLGDKLTKKESAELEALRNAIERPSALVADAEEQKWQRELERQQELLADLQKAMRVVEQASPKEPVSKKSRKKTS